MLNKEELKNTYIKYKPAITKEIFDKIITRIDSSYPRANRNGIIEDNFTFESFKGNYTYLWIDKYDGNLCWSLDNHQGSLTKQIQVSDILGEETSSSKPGFIVGKWYKYNKWYIKFKRLNNNLWQSSEEISPLQEYKSKESNFGTWNHDEKILLKDLEEIQQYLPEGHIDKLPTKPKEYVNVKSQEEWDFVTKKLGYKWTKAKYEGVKSCINLKGNTCSGNFSAYNTNNYYTFQEWLDLNNYTFPEKEEFKVGDWVCDPKHNSLNVGCVTEIISPSNIKCDMWYNFEGVAGNGGGCNSTYLRKATPEEIQKVTKSREPNMEKLLEEAKRRYPVGTKFNSTGGITNCIISNKTKYFIDNRGDVRVSFIDKIYGGSIYSGRTKEWAEIISLPETKEFDRNFYVEVNTQEEYLAFCDYMEAKGDKVNRSYGITGGWGYIIYDKEWGLIYNIKNKSKRPLSDFINVKSKLEPEEYILGFNLADTLIFSPERISIKETCINKEKLVLETVDVPRIKY